MAFAGDGTFRSDNVLNQFDARDPQIPLLLWWAIEAKAVSDRDAVLGLFTEAEAWRRPLVRDFLLERIGRRYLAENSDAGWRACAWLFDHAPGLAEVELLVKGMDLALEGRQLAKVPALLEKLLGANEFLLGICEIGCRLFYFRRILHVS